jgi:hypothetical protein
MLHCHDILVEPHEFLYPTASAAIELQQPNSRSGRLLLPPTCASVQIDIQREGDLMPTRITDDAFEYLIARAGLTLTDAEKTELKTVCDGIATMAERVRNPRGRMAEPALIYGFAEEDL